MDKAQTSCMGLAGVREPHAGTSSRAKPDYAGFMNSACGTPCGVTAGTILGEYT